MSSDERRRETRMLFETFGIEEIKEVVQAVIADQLNAQCEIRNLKKYINFLVKTTETQSHEIYELRERLSLMSFHGDESESA